MAEERVRRGMLLRTVMEILRDAGTKLSQQELDAELGRRVKLNSQELSVDNSGLPRVHSRGAVNDGQLTAGRGGSQGVSSMAARTASSAVMPWAAAESR